MLHALWIGYDEDKQHHLVQVTLAENKVEIWKVLDVKLHQKDDAAADQEQYNAIYTKIRCMVTPEGHYQLQGYFPLLSLRGDETIVSPAVEIESGDVMTPEERATSWIDIDLSQAYELSDMQSKIRECCEWCHSQQGSIPHNEAPETVTYPCLTHVAP